VLGFNVGFWTPAQVFSNQLGPSRSTAERALLQKCIVTTCYMVQHACSGRTELVNCNNGYTGNYKAMWEHMSRVTKYLPVCCYIR
jgi:hypothetical protein